MAGRVDRRKDGVPMKTPPHGHGVTVAVDLV